jgi:hypothetical protein
VREPRGGIYHVIEEHRAGIEREGENLNHNKKGKILEVLLKIPWKHRERNLAHSFRE